MDNPSQKWLMTVLKRILMVKDTTPSWCVMRECGLEPLQFNLFRAAVRLYNALTQSNSSTARKILRADMQLSSRWDDCWSSHNLSAMDGLHEIPGTDVHASAFMSCSKIKMSDFKLLLREQMIREWKDLDQIHPHDANVSSRIMRTYHTHSGVLIGS